MSPSTRTYIERAFREKSTRQIVEDMAEVFWPPVTFAEVERVRREMVAAGKKPLQRRNEDARVLNPNTPPANRDYSEDAAIRMACDALLRAHLRTGKHWIADPAAFASACASVGLSV